MTGRNKEYGGKAHGKASLMTRTSLMPRWDPESSLILEERCRMPLLLRLSGGSENGSTKASLRNTSGISSASGSDAVSAVITQDIRKWLSQASPSGASLWCGAALVKVRMDRQRHLL